MSAEHLASEASQEYFLTFGKLREEHARKCAGVRHMRGPTLHSPPKILEIGPCAKHCRDFKTAESTHVQPRNFPQRNTPASVEFQAIWTLEQSFGGSR